MTDKKKHLVTVSLGARSRVEFNLIFKRGEFFLDWRKYFINDRDERWTPTKKGFHLPLKEAKMIQAGLDEALKEAEDHAEKWEAKYGNPEFK